MGGGPTDPSRQGRGRRPHGLTPPLGGRPVKAAPPPLAGRVRPNSDSPHGYKGERTNPPKGGATRESIREYTQFIRQGDRRESVPEYE